jgi:DNA mismatch repair protein MSH2
VLAQIGSFVPASQATLPIIDKILTRVGAYDCAIRGASTFMVEMQEVATIIRRVTPESLVIIDELGRGTSTHDGFGIAWATIESLRASKAVVLFATHFHELSLMEEVRTDSSRNCSDVQNLSVNAHIPECGDSITMLYSIQKGACQKSYGIDVAKLLKFPLEIIEEATSIGQLFEKKTKEVVA